MKFGKRLETEALEGFRSFYIQYKELKKALKVFTGKERDQATVQEVTHWTSSFLRLGPNPEVPPEAKLNDVLESELRRVGKFAALQEDRLRSQLARLEEDTARASGEGDRQALRKRLDELGEQVVRLKSFVQLNFTGFRKILKKYDKCSKSAVLTWFMGKVVRAPLMCVNFEILLLQFNRIALALAEDDPGGEEPDRFGNPDGDPGCSAKEVVLLMLPKDTMWAKVQLARHLRLAPPPAGAPPPAAPAEAARPLRPRTTCCYFDTADSEVYEAYVSHTSCGSEGSSSVSGRTARPTKPSPCALLHLREDADDTVHLVRTSMGSLPSTEVPLTRAEASQLVKGQFVATPAAARTQPSEAEKKATSRVPAEAVLGEFRCAVTQGLQPAAQTSSRRSSFRADGRQLTATLEEDIKMALAREWGARPDSMDYVPYNVLQISCAPGAAPKWLQRVFDSPDVMQVSGFSLALHAIARCRAKDTTLPLPHWYRSVMESFAVDDEKPSEGYSEESNPKPKTHEASIHGRGPKAGGQDGSRSAPSATWRPGGAGGARLLHEFGPERAVAPPPGEDDREEEEAAEPAADRGSLGAALLARPAGAGGASSRARRAGLLAYLFGQGGGAEPATATEGLPVRRTIVTVQPKTVYSNERTFLEWIHFATIFAVLGLGMMHHAPRASGVCIGRLLVALAIFLVLWSLNTFNWRAEALDGKEATGYHDPVGPPVLILGMLTGLVLSSLFAVELI